MMLSSFSSAARASALTLGLAGATLGAMAHPQATTSFARAAIQTADSSRGTIRTAQEPGPTGRLLADVPMYYADSGHASIPVRIGTRELWFIVDLGAQTTVLYPATRDALGVAARSLGSTSVNGAGGATNAERVEIDSLRVGEIVQTSLPVLVMDIEAMLHMTPSQEHPISGIIGRDMLRGHDLVFDFPARRFRIYDRDSSAASPPAPGAAPRSVHGRNGLVCVPNFVDDHGNSGEVVVALSVNGHTTHAYLDTGAPTTLLSDTIAQAAGLTPQSPGVSPETRWTGGVGGQVKQYKAEGVKLVLGGNPLFEHTVRFGSIRVPAASVIESDQPTMLLGLHNLKDRTVVLSYSTNEMCLGPAKPLPHAKVNKK